MTKDQKPSTTAPPAAPNGHGNPSTTLVEDIDEFMASCDERLATQPGGFLLCPYHNQQLLVQVANPLNGPSVMERFLAEDMSEQYAISVDPVTGGLSITKPCTCGVGVNDTSIPQWQMAEFIVNEVPDKEST